MKNRSKYYQVLGLIVAAFLMAQIGCSFRKHDNQMAAAGPTPTPDTADELLSPTPTPEPTLTVEEVPSPGGTPNADGSSSNVASRDGKQNVGRSDVAANSKNSSSPRQSGDPTHSDKYSANSERPNGEHNSEGHNGEQPAPPPPPRVYTIKEGTNITISTAKTLSTKLDKPGDYFEASLAKPITDGDWVIAKRGALVEGEVVKSDPGGRVSGVASMTIKLRSLQLADGRKIPLSTNSYSKQAKSTKKKDAAKIGIGAGLGAAIGAIAGGGKGAAIGAAAGGGAGGGYVLATRGDPAEISGESELTFQIQEPITVTKRH